MSDNTRQPPPSLQVLFSALESIEDEFDEGMNEYALISRLQRSPFFIFDEAALRDSLALFQCHFILFHALYRLQGKWLEEGKGWLDIHATQIKRTPLARQKSMLADNDPLRDYYLDWKNFDSTSKNDVETLIASFWTKMAGPANVVVNPSQIQEARALLHIDDEDELTKELVKKHYRRLQHQHHPDKGGDNAASGQLVWAYDTLISIV